MDLSLQLLLQGVQLQVVTTVTGALLKTRLKQKKPETALVFLNLAAGSWRDQTSETRNLVNLQEKSTWIILAKQLKLQRF